MYIFTLVLSSLTKSSSNVLSPSQRLTLLVLADSQAGSSELRRAVRESWVRYPCVGISASVIFTVAAQDLSSDE
jgi:hypothetical protein